MKPLDIPIEQIVKERKKKFSKHNICKRLKVDQIQVLDGINQTSLHCKDPIQMQEYFQEKVLGVRIHKMNNSNLIVQHILWEEDQRQIIYN